MKKLLMFSLIAYSLLLTAIPAQNTDRLDQKTYRSTESLLRQVIDDTTQALRVSHVKDTQATFTPLTARNNRSIEQILLALIDESSNSLRINDLDNNYVDLTGVADGSMLVVEDGELVAKTEAQIKDSLYAYIKESTNKIELGDVNGLLNSTKVVVDDVSKTIDINAFGTIQIGDISANGYSTLFTLEDAVRKISLGDVSGSFNGTKIVMDDVNSKISTTGHNVITELTTNPTLTAGSESGYYMKGDKFIVAYNDGGTTKYRYLTLTSTDATWTYTTTAP